MLYSFAFPVWKAMLQQLTHTHSLAPRLVFVCAGPSIIALLPVSRESSQASVGARVSESVSI